MKSYKEFEKLTIGSSDYGLLILAGPSPETVKEIQLRKLCFGEDGTYSAYIVHGSNVSIGEHYQKIAEFKSWLRIYEDDGLARRFEGNIINVYQAGMRGCIIQII